MCDHGEWRERIQSLGAVQGLARGLLKWPVVIDPIRGWSWDVRQSGILMAPREDAAAGLIRYTERVRPVRRPLDAALSLTTPADHAITGVSTPEPFVTTEGEYGSLVVVDGTLGDQPVQRTIAVVFADDFYSLTVGVAFRREHFARIAATVAEVARGDAHMLGIRRRRFLYQPPAGWQGLAAGPYQAHWFPGDYPRNASMLTAYPALPATAGNAQVASLLVQHLEAAGIELAALGEPTAVASGSHLSGRWWSAEAGDGAVHDLVFFEDDRYLYPLVLQSPVAALAANRGLLREVIASPSRSTSPIQPSSSGRTTRS